MLIFLAMLDDPDDKDRFARLYNEYKGLAFWIANQILKDEYLAEVAVQEAFVRIAKNFSNISLDEAAAPRQTKSFVTVVVERAAIDIYRARKKQMNCEVLSEKIDDTMFALDEYGEESLLGESVLFQAVRQLPKQYGEIMLLHYVHDLSNQEIARLLDMKEATVRSNLSRGVSKLRALLLEDESGQWQF